MERKKRGERSGERERGVRERERWGEYDRERESKRERERDLKYPSLYSDTFNTEKCHFSVTISNSLRPDQQTDWPTVISFWEGILDHSTYDLI